MLTPTSACNIELDIHIKTLSLCLGNITAQELFSMVMQDCYNLLQLLPLQARDLTEEEISGYGVLVP